MNLRRLAALIALSFVASATPAVASAAATGRADRELDRALRQVVEAESGAPGVIAVVQRGDDRDLHAFGVGRLGGGEPRPLQRMRLASTSKAFSGAVALALVRKGALDLGDTVAELRPDLPAAWGGVTLQQALDHTSGIPTFTRSEEFFDALGASPLEGPSDQAELLSYVSDEPLGFAPGSSYEYSNSDNIVVALMAEAATGRGYRALLKRYVFRRFGLRRTSLPSTAEVDVPFIHGYDTLEDPQRPEDISEIVDPEWTGASGGLVSTPYDLNAFARGYVHGRPFGREARKRQFEFVKGGSEPPGPGRNSAGAGIFRYRTGCGTVYGHTGNIFGYTQFFAATPNGRRSVTVSANTQLSPDFNGEVFKLLRRADEKAVCAALAR